MGTGELMDRVASLSRALGHCFAHPELLTTALTHRSVAGESNERLEFLGDAVLNFVIAGELYRRFASATEGQLSRLRASLVKGDTLAEMAREVRLGDYLILGSGELKSGGFDRSSILADSFEAVIGAIYLDGGVEAAQRFVLTFFADKLDACNPRELLKDPKTRLQEFLQARGRGLPEYRVVGVQGQAHQQVFRVECIIPGLGEPVQGEGRSRRRAEQAAARRALDRLEA